MRREVRIARSEGLPSRFIKPPGILPAADMRSSMSTLKGKNVAPGRGFCERVAVESIVGVAEAGRNRATGLPGQLPGFEHDRAIAYWYL